MGRMHSKKHVNPSLNIPMILITHTPSLDDLHGILTLGLALGSPFVSSLSGWSGCGSMFLFKGEKSSSNVSNSTMRLFLKNP